MFIPCEFKMTLKDCLISLSSLSAPAKGPAFHSVCFAASEYPALFFARLWQHMKDQKVLIKPFLVEELEWAQIESRLTMSFLGQVETLWLGNISLLESTIKKRLITFLEQYHGPHCVLYFLETVDSSKNNQSAIDLNFPLNISDQEFLYTSLLNISQSNFIKSINAVTYKKLSLDQVCLLAGYMKCLGGGFGVFIEQWFSRIIKPEESLFTLAQYFFSKKRSEFFKIWLLLKDEYAGPFWTTFWSEQLWRAHHVVMFRKAGNFAQAKQMEARLPFSFLQKDWKQFSDNELLQAHDAIYALDYAFKNSASEYGIELFYHQFMQSDFQ